MFNENLSVYFEDFGVTAQVGGVAVRGLFDAAYTQGNVGLGGMAGAQPVFTCATADVAASAVGAALQLNGVNYVIAEVQPDGTGVTVLVLERA